jgi:hypothetical protein
MSFCIHLDEEKRSYCIVHVGKQKMEYEHLQLLSKEIG